MEKGKNFIITDGIHDVSDDCGNGYYRGFPASQRNMPKLIYGCPPFLLRS
ncbi:hypothetical protein RCO48_38065 [Peribacillus frigoritolerans]|nr:hypothetical protein [Peribacillus frigoritolerans]